MRLFLSKLRILVRFGEIVGEYFESQEYIRQWRTGGKLLDVLNENPEFHSCPADLQLIRGTQGHSGLADVVSAMAGRHKQIIHRIYTIH